MGCCHQEPGHHMRDPLFTSFMLPCDAPNSTPKRLSDISKDVNILRQNIMVEVRLFQIHFLKWRLLYCNTNFNERCSQMPRWQQVSVGLTKYLTPFMQKARYQYITFNIVIIRTFESVDPVNSVVLSKYALLSPLNFLYKIGLCVICWLVFCSL